MAHFAKLGINSKVLSVEVVADADCQDADGNDNEQVGIDFLNRIHGWPLWAKTSYNTVKNTHSSGDNSRAYRGNYAGIGYTWDEENEIFWPPKPHSSWSKNTTTASWDAPITYPSVTTYVDDSSTTQNWNIYWDEDAYQADNTKGWEATKVGATDVYEWDGSAWNAQA